MNMFLEGERIYLRGLKDTDVDGAYLQWLNDAEVCAGNSHHVFPYGREKALSYVRQVNESNKALVLAILLKGSDQHIGNIALQGLHDLYRKAEFAILLGDKDSWGKGYGSEAGKLVLKHGFHALNLNRIECSTFHTNTGMIKLALALGMKQEGVRKQAAFKNNSYVDLVEFGIVREDFDAPQLDG